MDKLSTKQYKNEFISSFKGEESGPLYPHQTPGVLYSKTIPTSVKKPELLAWSDDLALELGIEKPSKEDIDILSGNLVTPSMSPYAACYGGHQFGNWAGQLGDGRAITLGEWLTDSGKSYELQLKGAGRTAYSRRADGRAVLRSSLREHLMSEAIFHLGIPTTRALSLVTTGEQVLRDMFYNGNAQYETGAIVMRVAPSFLRFGSFEILSARNELDNLKQLVNWTIKKFYPHIQGEDKIVQWFKEVVDKTSSLIVEWMRVGFVHGVMNTDNMSILGLTIDYGPFSFVDDYDLNFTPNTTDLPGRRYAFGRQASIAHWNLACLAKAITPLLEKIDPLIEILENYEDMYLEKYYSMISNKLGFAELKDENISFINDFQEMLADIKPDMTIFYQLLTDIIASNTNLETKEDIITHFKNSFYHEITSQQSGRLNILLKSYLDKIKNNSLTTQETVDLMRKNNPRFILRNYLLHQAIEELEKGDNSLFLKLQEAIKDPYSNKFEEFFTKRPDWAAKRAGCSMLSCSS